MRAPAYRNLESRDSFMGLAFPFEVLFWLAGVTALVYFVVSVLGVLAGSAALYVAIRLSSAGRPRYFLRHLLLFHLRRRFAGGRLSAAARSRAPRLPFARHASGLPPHLAQVLVDLLRSAPS